MHHRRHSPGSTNPFTGRGLPTASPYRDLTHGHGSGRGRGGLRGGHVVVSSMAKRAVLIVATFFVFFYIISGGEDDYAATNRGNNNNKRETNIEDGSGSVEVKRLKLPPAAESRDSSTGGEGDGVAVAGDGDGGHLYLGVGGAKDSADRYHDGGHDGETVSGHESGASQGLGGDDTSADRSRLGGDDAGVESSDEFRFREGGGPGIDESGEGSRNRGGSLGRWRGEVEAPLSRDDAPPGVSGDLFRGSPSHSHSQRDSREGIAGGLRGARSDADDGHEDLDHIERGKDGVLNGVNGEVESLSESNINASGDKVEDTDIGDSTRVFADLHAKSGNLSMEKAAQMIERKVSDGNSPDGTLNVSQDLPYRRQDQMAIPRVENRANDQADFHSVSVSSDFRLSRESGDVAKKIIDLPDKHSRNDEHEKAHKSDTRRHTDRAVFASGGGRLDRAEEMYESGGHFPEANKKYPLTKEDNEKNYSDTKRQSPHKKDSDEYEKTHSDVEDYSRYTEADDKNDLGKRKSFSDIKGRPSDKNQKDNGNHRGKKIFSNDREHHSEFKSNFSASKQSFRTEDGDNDVRYKKRHTNNKESSHLKKGVEGGERDRKGIGKVGNKKKYSAAKERSNYRSDSESNLKKKKTPYREEYSHLKSDHVRQHEKSLDSRRSSKQEMNRPGLKEHSRYKTDSEMEGLSAKRSEDAKVGKNLESKRSSYRRDWSYKAGGKVKIHGDVVDSLGRVADMKDSGDHHPSRQENIKLGASIKTSDTAKGTSRPIYGKGKELKEQRIIAERGDSSDQKDDSVHIEVADGALARSNDATSNSGTGKKYATGSNGIGDKGGNIEKVGGDTSDLEVDNPDEMSRMKNAEEDSKGHLGEEDHALYNKKTDNVDVSKDHEDAGGHISSSTNKKSDELEKRDLTNKTEDTNNTGVEYSEQGPDGNQTHGIGDPTRKYNTSADSKDFVEHQHVDEHANMNETAKEPTDNTNFTASGDISAPANTTEAVVQKSQSSNTVTQVSTKEIYNDDEKSQHSAQEKKYDEVEVIEKKINVELGKVSLDQIATGEVNARKNSAKNSVGRSSMNTVPDPETVSFIQKNITETQEPENKKRSEGKKEGLLSRLNMKRIKTEANYTSATY